MEIMHCVTSLAPASLRTPPLPADSGHRGSGWVLIILCPSVRPSMRNRTGAALERVAHRKGVCVAVSPSRTSSLACMRNRTGAAFERVAPRKGVCAPMSGRVAAHACVTGLGRRSSVLRPGKGCVRCGATCGACMGNRTGEAFERVANRKGVCA